MDIAKIGKFLDVVNAIFMGDARPVDLDGILPIKWQDLEKLLRLTDCIDLNGNLDSMCSYVRFVDVIMLYYCMKPTTRFTSKR